VNATPERDFDIGQLLSWLGVALPAEVTFRVAGGTNRSPGPEGTMSRSPSHFLFSITVALLAIALCPGVSQAQIVLSGAPTIDAPTTNGAGIVSPAAISATVTNDGFKVTGIDFSYTTPGGELGKNVSVSWVGHEALTTGPAPASIVFTDHLDGSLTYSTTSFALFDVKLRTITTDTDFDLTTLHLGPFPPGVPFDANVSSGTLTQPVGGDQLLQFFEMDFMILTNSPDTITIHLPDSVESSVSSVPEPPSLLMLASTSLALVLFCLGRRFLKRIRPAAGRA